MKPGKIRVVIVAPSLGVHDGQAVQADRLLRAWRDDPEIDAALVPINPPPPGLLRHGTRVKYLRTVMTQLTYWPLLARELRHADVVHVFSGSYLSFLLAPLPAVIVARLFRKPVLVNYRSGEAPDHLARSRIARFVLRRTDLNVVPSSFLAGVFEHFGLHAWVIHNIVNREVFRHRLRVPLRPRLLSTRNLEPLYNVACTIRAFRLVQDRHPEATLTIVGGGSEESRLRRLVAELGLQGVRFAGCVSPADIASYFEDADIYLQTPNVDSMPASVLEAYSSGLPVVSTDAGGVPSILTDGVHGLLAPIDDHAAVAAHILRLLDNPDLACRVSAAGLESCKAYSWPTVRSEWLAVYRGLAASSATAARAAGSKAGRAALKTRPSPAGPRATS
jgi:L-malate glycosyltransferase